jgi:hypothetical protein
VSTLSIPNVFVNGTTINASPFNTNFNAVATAVNNIDATNIGTVGLYASNLLPGTSAQATFGGTAGYTFLAPSVSTVPLIVSGITSQTAALQEWTLTSGGTNTISVDSFGNLIFPSFGGTVPTTNSAIFGVSGTSGNLQFNVGASGEYEWRANGSLISILAANGALSTIGALTAGSATAATVAAGDGAFSRSTTTGEISIGGSAGAGLIDFGVTAAGDMTISPGTFLRVAAPLAATQGGTTAFVAPVYTPTGAATASTMHIVTAQGTSVGATNASLTVTLSGAAAFSSSTSYVVTFTGLGESLEANVILTSGTSFTINTGDPPTVIAWMAIGV